MTAKQYRMERNQAGSSADIYLYGEIGYDITASSFIQDFAAIGPVDQLNIRMCSPGGEASEGLAIYNTLMRSPAERCVFVDSAAFSITSAIAMCASPGKLVMMNNARMMIHNAWGITVGDGAAHMKAGERLSGLNTLIAPIYAERSGKSVDEVLALMGVETYLTAQQAIAAGLADDVQNPADGGAFMSAAKFDPVVLARYKQMPADVRAMFERNDARGKISDEELASEERQMLRHRVAMRARAVEVETAIETAMDKAIKIGLLVPIDDYKDLRELVVTMKGVASNA